MMGRKRFLVRAELCASSDGLTVQINKEQIGPCKKQIMYGIVKRYYITVQSMTPERRQEYDNELRFIKQFYRK